MTTHTHRNGDGTITIDCDCPHPGLELPQVPTVRDGTPDAAWPASDRPDGSEC